MAQSMKHKFFYSVALLLFTCVGQMVSNAQVKPANTNIDFKKLTAPRKLLAIQPLQPSVKLAMVKEILKHRMGAKTVDSSTLAQPIILSVANSVQGSSYLRFDAPKEVGPVFNQAEFPAASLSSGSLDCGLSIFFNAPEDGYYVFDFSVAVYSPLTFSFYNPTVLGGPQKIENHNKLSHVIAVTQEPLKAGPNQRLLTSFDSNWFFSSVEISQLKVSN